MQKLPMHTKNIADENFRKLAELFPQAVTEVVAGHDENGKAIIERAIDKDVLMAEIAAKVVDGPNIGENQRYQFTWPDKAKTVHASNQPIYKTLRPCREESVNFDDTENLYIEGDNLEVLKLLQESYLGKVKMIYIDPPYNTGNDFVYNDHFTMDRGDWDELSGDYDEEGNRLFKNTDSNGRFHTDWLNMLYPRLKIARDLLSDDGVIFISIDEHELGNMQKCLYEVFGPKSLDILIWRKNAKQGNTKKINRFKLTHEYILAAYKKKASTTIGKVKLYPNWKGEKGNADNDPRGNWESGVISRNEEKSNMASDNYYSIVLPSGRIMTREFFFPKKQFEQYLLENKIYFPKDGDGVPRLKIFEKEEQDYFFDSIIDEMGTFTDARAEIEDILGNKDFFDTPKPLKILKELTRATASSNSIILDFFAGSSTTAHAVMQLNAEDGGKRKFIMVQLSEDTDEKSEAFKAGYANICEIGKERIRRAGAKILVEFTEKNTATKQGDLTQNLPLTTNHCLPDIGFRVLKVDSTNMEQVYYTPKEYTQNMLVNLEENIKKDRTPEDLLFQVMLELAVPLSCRIEELTIDNTKIFSVDKGYLMACFDSKIQESIVEHVAKQKPYYFVMRDSSIGTDSLSTNFEQIFATYSPATQLKVL